MKKVWLLILPIVSSIRLGMVLFSTHHNKSTSTSYKTVDPPPQRKIQSRTYILTQSVVHTLLIPTTSNYVVTSALSPSLDTVEDLAAKHQAIAAINGGFFDPVNQKTTFIVIQQGVLVADPKRNERLINNPKNAPYLKQILNRSEFRRYDCGGSVRYDITLHSTPAPSGCRLVDALGGGPRLLPLSSIQEGFLDIANGRVILDSISSNRPNARTAIGITYNGSIMWVMVAQKQNAPTSSGLSLAQLAELMKSMGVEKAMNLDGGSSSSFYYQGKTLYGKVNAAGNPVKRPVKSVLLIQENHLASQN